MALITYSNEENKKLGQWLLSRIDGRAMMSQAKNAIELEKLVFAYAKKKGSIAGMDYVESDSETNEGLNWVTFADLFVELNLVESK